MLQIHCGRRVRKKGEKDQAVVILLNPRILKRQQARVIRSKGCLSMPGYTGNVLRYDRTVWKGMTLEAGVPHQANQHWERWHSNTDSIVAWQTLSRPNVLAQP